MTRDAKIGMLTGLGVIVLIGVLLSQYLGDPQAALAMGAPLVTSNGATGRMASLPVGEDFRQQVMEPVAVPTMVAENLPVNGMGPNAEGAAGGAEIVSPINTTSGVMPPTIYAVDRSSDNVPTQTGMVTPVAVGRMPTETGMVAADPPVIVLADGTQAVPLPGDLRGDLGAKLPAGSVTYEIAEHDNLGKIARKFYNSSKNSDVQRIVAANPGVLKDANSTLMTGKKLVIPGVAMVTVSKRTFTTPATPTEPSSGTPALRKVEPGAGGVIPMPGDSRKAAPPSSSDKPAKADVTKKDTTRKESSKTYQVQSGDTLEKIAKKIAPSKPTEMVSKLMSMNGIKDPHGLQAGVKLKVPA